MSQNETNEAGDNGQPTITQFINENIRFTQPTRDVMRAFARLRPWRGSARELNDKWQEFHLKLCTANDVECDFTIAIDDGDTDSTGSNFIPGDLTSDGRPMIVLRGKLSIVTYLHLFGFLLDMNTEQRIAWSVNLFKRFFPRSFAACRANGMFLIR